MVLRSRLATLVAGTLMMSACGDSTTGSPTDTTSPPSQDFALQYAREICRGQAGCCQRGQHALDEAACVDTWQRSKQQEGDELLRRGLSFDPENAARCLSWLRTEVFDTCVIPSSLVTEPFCDEVFHGQGAQGTPCSDHTCGRGPDGVQLRCTRSAQTPVFAQTCQPTRGIESLVGRRGHPGEGCVATAIHTVGGTYTQPRADASVATDVVCYLDDDLFCDETRHCAPRPLAGEPCESEFLECAPGLVCSGAGACKAGPGPGQPCAFSEGCADGARCASDGSDDVEHGVCEAMPSLGEACHETPGSSPCDRSSCVEGICQSLLDLTLSRYCDPT